MRRPAPLGQISRKVMASHPKALTGCGMGRYDQSSPLTIGSGGVDRTGRDEGFKSSSNSDGTVRLEVRESSTVLADHLSHFFLTQTGTPNGSKQPPTDEKAAHDESCSQR